jgi:hypothetical protein
MRVSMTSRRPRLALQVLAGMTMYSSLAQNITDKRIVVDIVDGRVHADPARLMPKDSEMRIEWVQGMPSVPFRIEFPHNNPCNSGNSRLDQDPAVCVVTRPHPGTYKYRIIPQGGHSHVSPGVGVIIFARVKSWGAGCS